MGASISFHSTVPYDMSNIAYSSLSSSLLYKLALRNQQAVLDIKLILKLT